MQTAGSRSKIFVTEAGLYQLIMRSNKANAQRFRTWVSGILVQIRQRGFYSLQQEAEETSGAKLHEALLRAFAKINCVYLAEVAPDVLKIGHSTNLPRRDREQRAHFGSFRLLHCCQVHDYFQFERWLLDNQDVVERKVDHVGDVYTRECFRPDEAFSAQKLIELMEQSKKDFNDPTVEHVRLERERVQLERDKIQLQLQQLHASHPHLSAATPPPPGGAVPQLLRAGLPHCTRVQQYTPEGSYVTTHDSIATAARIGGTPPQLHPGVSRAQRGHQGLPLETARGRGARRGHRAPATGQVQQAPQRTRGQAEPSQGRDCQRLQGLQGSWRRCGVLQRHNRETHPARQQVRRTLLGRMGPSQRGPVRERYIADHGMPSFSLSNSAKAVLRLDKDTGDVVGCPASMTEIVTELQTSHKSLREAIEGRRVLRGTQMEMERVNQEESAA